MIKKIEELRNALEVGPILTVDEMHLIIKTLEITVEKIKNKEMKFDEMFDYVFDKKSNARENYDWNTFDSYDNAISKITATINNMLF